MERVDDPTGHQRRLEGGRLILADDDELVAAEAGDGVAGAHDPAQPVGHRHQQLVAGGVTPAVVDQLETVEVDEQHRHLAARPAGAGQGLVEPLGQQHAVGQPGQGVVDGLVGQLELGQLALAHVPHRRRHPHPLLRPQRGEADLDGELRAVGPAGVEVEVGAHRPQFEIRRRVGLAVNEVTSPEALGQQHLHRLPDEMVPAPAEQLLRLAVDQHDPPVPVDDDDAVGGRLQQIAELLLAPAAAGDVLGRAPESEEVAGLVDLGQPLAAQPADLAAGPDDAVVEGHHPPVPAAVGDGRADHVAVAVVDPAQVLGVARLDLRRVGPEDAVHLVRPGEDVGSGLPLPAADVGDPLRLGQPLPVPPQCPGLLLEDRGPLVDQGQGVGPPPP